MTDLSVFVFIVVPIAIVNIVLLGLLAARLAEESVQKHVDRLAQIRAKRPTT